MSTRHHGYPWFGTRSWARVVLGAGILLAAGALPTQAQFVEPDVTVLRTHTSADPTESFGWAGESIGDINGDGASEYLISAPFNSSVAPNAGRVVLYDGATGAVLNEVMGNAFEQLGYSVCGPGDVNGDGVPDYAMGGIGVFGAPGPQPGRLLVLSGADDSVLLDVAGPADRTFFGYDSNAAGDLNGDGTPDLIVGAPLANTALARAGSVHAISGVDGSILWTYSGEGAFYFLGTGVSGVGDLDGDGTPEVATATFQGGNQGVGEGYILDGTDGSVKHVLKPKQKYFSTNFGTFFVHNAGDTDADGVNDVYIGDFGNPTQPGVAYIWSGANPEERRAIVGELPPGGFGIGRGVGDVDGDGYDDLYLAAFRSSDGAVLAGKSAVYSGRNLKVIRTMTGNVANSFLGFDALGLGDVNADGEIDFLLTGVSVAHVIAGNPAP